MPPPGTPCHHTPWHPLPCHHTSWHPLQAREPLGLISSQHPQIIRRFAEPKQLRAGDVLQLHCVYDNTASDRPSGYGSDETGEMCNQYLLSDLRLQTRGSKAGAVLAPLGAVLAAMEPRSPGLGRRKGAGLWNRGGGLWNRGGALEQRWGSGPPLRAREAPSERPGAHAVAPSAWAPQSADPAATEHEQADALRPGRAAAQPHVRGLAARGGRRPRHRPAAPPGREANHVAEHRVIELF